MGNPNVDFLFAGLSALEHARHDFKRYWECLPPGPESKALVQSMSRLAKAKHEIESLPDVRRVKELIAREL